MADVGVHLAVFAATTHGGTCCVAIPFCDDKNILVSHVFILDDFELMLYTNFIYKSPFKHCG